MPKRSFEEAIGGSDNTNLLHRIRNSWEFANLAEWIFIFGKAAKIDDSIDAEVIEFELQKPTSTILQEVALALTKMASSFRGITHETLDEQIRKLYNTYAPDANPLGDEDSPARLEELDALSRVRVLQRLTQWVMRYPERFRDKMEEQKDKDQTDWRIEPYGWDSDDRTYFVLDDNRLYRLTEAPPPPEPLKKTKKQKTYRGGRRTSRRTTTSSVADDQGENPEEEHQDDVDRNNGLGGMKWECLAVTLAEVQSFVNSIAKTRDDNEKILRDQIRDHLLPILEKQEESRVRKEQQRQREALTMAKMANAKRSSRLAGKAELQKLHEEAEQSRREEAKQREIEKKEEAARQKRERERDNRLASREDRLKERQTRRRLHEEELAQLSEDSRNPDDGRGRISDRQRQADIQKKQLALQELDEEDDDWMFDCVCGLYGKVDDGSHSVACERCNTWQHSKCLGVSEKDAEKPDFQFVCHSCAKREEERSQKTTIKLKVHDDNEHVAPPNTNARIIVALPARSRADSDETIDDPEYTASSAVPAHITNGVQERSGAEHAPAEVARSEVASPQKNGVPPTKLYEPAPISPANNSYDRPVQPVSLEMRTPLQSREEGSFTNGSNGSFLASTPTLNSASRGSFLDLGDEPMSSGISPIKHSPQVPSPAPVNVSGTAKLKLSASTSLTPAEIPQDPTPPVKSIDHRMSFSQSREEDS